LRFVAAVSASCSGDKSDKEESAGGFRCYGDCALRLQRWMSKVSDCVMTGCAIQLIFPIRLGQFGSHVTATGVMQPRFL
ncbi:hypothetical protein, partial [Roseobacter sinensis]